jgi:hypothetical protein
VSNVLASISGQFSKSLILGTFFPVLLFVSLAFLFVPPLLPEEWALFAQFGALDAQWRLVAFSLVVLLITGVLYNLNILLLRLYEGYPWRKSWIGEWKTARHQAEFDSLYVRQAGLRTLVYALAEANNPENHKLADDRWQHVGNRRAELPNRRDLVLPTRLGNVIRNFEGYAVRQYGIDSIVVWPRLIAKIDKDYAAAIDDTKASFDFVLNSSALAAVVGLAVLLSGLLYPTPLASFDLAVGWLIEVGVCAVLAYWLYVAALGRAHAWGGLVKGAFDLYRWDLLKQLGYTRVPRTMQEERRMWLDITQQMQFGDSPRVSPAEYSPLPTSARAEPDYVEVQSARGVSSPDASGAVSVSISIENVDRRSRAATAVTVTDNLADGFDYEWDSARVDGQRVTALGGNPCRFRLGRLEAGGSVLLRYRAVRTHQPGKFDED